MKTQLQKSKSNLLGAGLLLNTFFSFTVNAQWTPLNSTTTNSLMSTYFMDANIGLVVGNSGLILKTTNGGNSWTTIPSFTTQTLNSIHFFDNLNGFIAGNYVVLRTTDGGNTWSDVTPDNTQLYLSVFSASEFIAYTSTYGGKVHKTTNGGLTWTQQSTGTGNPLFSIFFTDANNGYAAGGGIGAGNIVKTNNGGSGWSFYSTFNQHYSVFFVNDSLGYVSGGNNMRTVDKGASWTYTPIIFTTAFGVNFISDKSGYYVGGSGIILFTSDSANTSCIQESNTSNTLRSVYFINDTIGYAAGDNGTIIKTTNGGKSCPISSFSASDTNICIGDMVTFTSNQNYATDYSWQENGITFSTSQNATRSFNTLGTYVISHIVNKPCGNCSPDTSFLTINVNPFPVADAGINDTICQGDSTQLNAAGGTSFSWLPSTGLSNNAIASPMASPSVTTTYFLTVTDAYGCSAQDNVKIVVLSNPSPVITASGPTTFCQGDSVILTSSVAASYQWNMGATTQSITVSFSGNYSVTIPNTNGCFATSSITVTVNPLPSVSLVLSPDTVCISAGAYTLTGGSPNGGAYSGPGVSGGIFDPNSAGTGLHSIVYTYTDSNGCTNSAIAPIFVDVCTGGSFYFTTDFIKIYPNPGKGQLLLEIYDIETDDYELKIYNTMGELVYESLISDQKTEIDISVQPKGMYFIHLLSEEKLINKKIIVQ